ncbi:CotH kinase family protein [Bacillus alkalisoli]|uniref:CotH kinase family protein n=1 Tax=Bacillus alkalisoli TaxID=2011008 RepID=UPI000C24DA5B|nr:CotH kinase family protein [Bacillus alkalisoli]
MTKQKLLLLLVFPILFIAWYITYALASGPIIKDENLEKAIRIAINYEVGEIRADQLKGIQELVLRDSEIEDLEGIQHLTALVSLDLRDNNIKDISKLSTLTNLHELNLRGNEITNIEAIANMTALRELNIRDNKISDITPLQNLVLLRDLNLRNNRISNIKPLQSLDNLRDRLYLEGNLINDFTPVMHFYEQIQDTDFTIENVSSAEMALPIFSQNGGFFSEEMVLEITSPAPDAIIYYTLDGSEPDPVHNEKNTLRYEGPIPIKDRTPEDNVWSMIPTNNNVESRFWSAPQTSVPKGTVVRAAKFINNWKSETVTHTYFIQQDYTIPVISLSTDSENLFSDEKGIYVPGMHHDPNAEKPDETGNYYESGTDWERPIHIEYFETDGKRAFAQNAGVRIHGAFTRRLPQKTLRLYSRSDYGTSRFSYQFFDEKPIDDFNRLLLRNSGNDWGSTMFRDAAIQTVIRHMNMESQYYKPAIVFMNGEYWGIHNIRDRIDQHYFETHYGRDRSNFTILDRYGNLEEGDEQGVEDYANMVDYAVTNNLNEPTHFDHIEKSMDIDNYIEYYVAQIYNANTDWPQNNISFWRYENRTNESNLPKQLDGRWRWYAYDMDRSLGSVEAEHDTIAWATRAIRESTQQDEWSTALFRALLESDEFKRKFINTFADHLNTTFAPERVIAIIEELQANIEPEMDQHIKRWNAPTSMNIWRSNVMHMKGFVRKRPAQIRSHIMAHFNLLDKATITILTEIEGGTVQVNSIEIRTPGVVDPSNWTGHYFQGVPITITATPKPGYKFVEWKDLNNTQQTIELTLTNNITIQPIFEKE